MGEAADPQKSGGALHVTFVILREKNESRVFIYGFFHNSQVAWAENTCILCRKRRWLSGSRLRYPTARIRRFQIAAKICHWIPKKSQSPRSSFSEFQIMSCLKKRRDMFVGVFLVGGVFQEQSNY